MGRRRRPCDCRLGVSEFLPFVASFSREQPDSFRCDSASGRSGRGPKEKPALSGLQEVPGRTWQRLKLRLAVISVANMGT